MIRNLSSHIIRLVIYLILQVLVFREVALFDTGFNFIYLIGLILLPIEIGHLLLIGVGFFVGLTVDIFYNTQGMHAAACTLIMFIRPYFFNRSTGGSYEPGTALTVREMGLTWFIVFTLPMIFVHHFVLFFVESGSWNLFFFTFTKVLFSSIFTFIVALMLQYLLTKPRRRI